VKPFDVETFYRGNLLAEMSPTPTFRPKSSDVETFPGAPSRRTNVSTSRPPENVSTSSRPKRFPRQKGFHVRKGGPWKPLTGFRRRKGGGRGVETFLG
jgi:hypothetical protein